MQRLLILVFLMLMTLSVFAQQTGIDVQQQSRKINRLSWQLYQLQQSLDSLQISMEDIKRENDSLNDLLYNRSQELEDSIAHLNYLMDEGFQRQQDDVNKQMLKMRERFFILAAIILLLAVAVFAMFIYFGKRSRENAYLMEVNLDEQVTRIQHSLEKKTGGIQKRLDDQMSHMEQRLNQLLQTKISSTKEDLASDKRLIHASALALTNELQDIENTIAAGLKRKEARKYRVKASGLKKQLNRLGYSIAWFDGKKVKEKMDVDIENMAFTEAIGKRVDKTLRPQLIFGGQIIQKALLRMRVKTKN